VGRSRIVGSQGWTVAGPASHDREEVLVAPVDLAASRRARQLNDFNHVLRDRRRDLYDELLGAAEAPRQR
ncbi:hydratase, partial [Achromobacter ruhlandii]|nr:hydratase [Achromobacter ruhlandii]